MFGDEPYQGAFRAAAEATRDRIRKDRARAPRALRKVFTVVANRLFQPSLNAGEAFNAAGIKDCTLRAVFKQATGIRLSRYIAEARIEVAYVLIVTTSLDVTMIGEMVGYTYHPTFADNYKRAKDMLPSDVVREPLAVPLIDVETALKAAYGALDDGAMVDHLEDLMRLSPTAAKCIRERICPVETEPPVIVDGARDDQLKAEGIWQEIRDLPFADQCQLVRGFRFCSTVLFDLLRKVSRLEGRKKRQRGIELAKLALVSLERSDRVFGDRIHDLRAHGWAWLGNAYRLALDFSEAAAAFEQSDREWSNPRAQLDQLVLANICALKGTLWMMRRDYDAATRELDRSCSLYHQSGLARDEARELITRASIHGYAGKLKESVEDLRGAVVLIDEDKDRELAFAARCNLANTMARAGETRNAEEELDRARQLSKSIHDPLGLPKLDWIDGLISEHHRDLEAAKSFYLAARSAFRDADERRCFGRISVSLMIVHSMQDDWERVGVLASTTLPILTSLDLHTETLTTVGYLVRAVEAGSLTHRLLTELRDALCVDPLM